jgi:hypothetical protein
MAEALARGGEFVLLRSGIRIEQTKHVITKMIMASTSAHVNPLMVLPA